MFASPCTETIHSSKPLPFPLQRGAFRRELESLTDQVKQLKIQVDEAEAARRLADKEQEDLLVLLEDVTEKRKLDKAKLRELGAEVSEDEDDDEE